MIPTSKIKNENIIKHQDQNPGDAIHFIIGHLIKIYADTLYPSLSTTSTMDDADSQVMAAWWSWQRRLLFNFLYTGLRMTDTAITKLTKVKRNVL